MLYVNSIFNCLYGGKNAMQNDVTHYNITIIGNCEHIQSCN